ncbi:MAG: aminodeoxychorismate synthase component I [Opitutaceae bacterium]|nr:aminodeoxychorismate synthase component I [Opitutaceae bacterium]
MSSHLISGRVAPHRILAWAAPAPEEALDRLERRQGVFWLDSSLRTGAAGRFSIMGCQPFGVFRSRGREFSMELDGVMTEVATGDPLEALGRWLAEFQVERETDCPVPFCGGAVGFLAYDLGRIIERVGDDTKGDAGPPDIHLAWYDAAAVWDHATGQSWLVGAGWRRSPETALRELASWMEGEVTAQEETAAPSPAPEVQANFTRAGYLAAVGQVRERIAAGEIYQMNLAQRFTCPLVEPPPLVYRRLRRLNPAPMAAYLDAGDRVVLSSSPERFIEVDGRCIRTFPVKGTRPRGRTPAEDGVRQQELCASEKERAELLMIVDLMRNDLGRVCRFGSVRVRRLHSLETFATVHHLVGEVVGELLPETGVAKLLRAVFPGGSITGAPKIRAMQIIDAIEPVRRGVFSGSLGYFSACGRIDLNIAIRTVVCHAGRADFHLGAGIVWDSDPAAEYDETLAKGRALFAALTGRDGA